VRWTIAVAGIVLLVAACGAGGDRYPAHGVVRDVQREFGQVTIEHGDIPGLMSAMTMNFDVPDAALLERLERGQVLEFTVEFTGRSYRVVEAVVVERETGAAAAQRTALAAERTPVPDFELTDQAGRTVTLASLRGKTLLLDFVYTSCPGPCPILTSQHAALQRALSPDVRERVWFVSISVDPERDTPDALRAYAEARGADLARWSFLTGPSELLADLVERMGVGTIREPDGTIEHTVVTFVVDADGRIAERFLGLEHDPEEVRRALERIASA
jgi:protein SCO1/2